MENKFYVYAHRRNDSNEIFYIGKGTGNRAEDTNNRNKYWHNVVNKHGFKTEILVNNICEDKAFELEKEFICQIGRENLVNMTDGGEGISGLAHSEETRQKMSVSKRGEKAPWFGKQLNEEHRAKLSEAIKGKKHSAAARQKMSESHPKNPVLQYTKHGQFIAEFNSIREAYRATEINPGNISKSCQGKLKSAGGFIWRYKEID